jgi:multidrug efflux pump subunit AcrA (membrane-fusion protein)
MKYAFVSSIILASIVLAACASPASQQPVETQIPIVVADPTIIAEGHVEPIHYAEIAFTASGVISEVLVTEGQHVRKGETLIRLGNESDTNYAAAQLDLVSAQQALDDLILARDEKLAESVIALKEAQEKFDKAENYLKYLQTSQRVPQTTTKLILVQTWKGYQYDVKTKNFKGPAPKDWIIEADNDLALKKAILDEAQRAYDRLKDGPDSEQLPILEARLDAAKARLATFAVVAPFNGVVAYLHATTGSSINAGEVAVTVADFSSWVIQTNDVTEIDVVNLAEGQTVIVTLDAIPDVELQGKVHLIGQSYSENQGDIVYEVTVILSEKHPAMRWGMTAAVKFEPQD